MELRLQAADGCALPPDTYICVKIGDVLKQQRYDSKKALSFPSVVHRRQAKVDLFRRIGTCEVELNPAVHGVQEIAVVKTDAGAGPLRLKLDVQPTAPVDLKGMMKSPHNISSARAYLAEHNLEQMFQNVVQLLLNDRPQNPKEYICTYVQTGKAPEQSPKDPPKGLDRPSSADGRSKLPPLEPVEAVPQPPSYVAPASSPGTFERPEAPAKAAAPVPETSAEDALAAAEASLAAVSAEGKASNTDIEKDVRDFLKNDMKQMLANKSAEEENVQERARADSVDSIKAKARNSFKVSTENGDLQTALRRSSKSAPNEDPSG